MTVAEKFSHILDPTRPLVFERGNPQLNTFEVRTEPITNRVDPLERVSNRSLVPSHLDNDDSPSPSTILSDKGGEKSPERDGDGDGDFFSDEEDEREMEKERELEESLSTFGLTDDPM